MSIEQHDRQRQFQRWLDLQFPEGARVSLLSFRGGVMKPDFQMETGRLFCSQAALVPDGWLYEIHVDPNIPGTDDLDLQRPFRVWIETLIDIDDVEHELWESPVLRPDGSEVEEERVRILPGMGNVVDVGGQEISVERMREYATERWEGQFFPDGLEAVVQ